MATMRPVLVILLLALFGIYSCGDDSPTGSGGDTIHDPFPNAVGMLWKYEVYDSLAETVDTVWVSVTEMRVSIAEISAYQWRLYWQSSGEVEDRVVGFRGDTIDILTDSTQGDIELLERFVFPLEEGATWIGPSIYDTCRVTEIGTVVVPAGTFRNSALVEHAWNLDFEGGGNWTETWLAPDVGIAYRHEYQAYSDGTTITVLENQVWRLIEYDLRTFSLAQFPNTIGTQWVYQVVSTTAGFGVDTVFVDTVTVTVIDRVSILGPDSLLVWEFLGREYADSSFVGTLNNIVTVSSDTLQMIPPSPAWSYEFPMTVGKYWGTVSPTCRVSDKCLVSTPAGNFQTTFCCIESGGMPGSWMVRDWLAPGVGVVKRVYSPFTAYPMPYQEWTLLSFDPAP